MFLTAPLNNLLTMNELLQTTHPCPRLTLSPSTTANQDAPLLPPPPPCILQDQYKFIYDTLEEFVQCGYTYFPVKEISQALREKSKKQEGGKRVNQYEKEYVVRPQRLQTQQ